jgi:N-methylhydantoinase A/oxoprolinase/acetone carboxylase beta subunit
VIGSHPRQAQGDQYTPLSVEEVAFGFVQVANEAMCRPIRALTQSKVRRNERALNKSSFCIGQKAIY